MIEEKRNIIDAVDHEMAALFEKRMLAAREIAQSKREMALPIADPVRENQIIAANSRLIEDEEIRKYYIDFLRSLFTISRRYQSCLNGFEAPCHDVENSERDTCDIVVERGALARVGEHLDLGGKTLVVTDSGVPEKYARAVLDSAEQPFLKVVPQGEASKSLESLTDLLELMTRERFTRTDKVVAVGGGVVGDLAGLAAATFMRGIDFYNIPTTLLSQLDSSIGGKTAIDFCGVKNIIGAFHQPRKVVIDPDTLDTLCERQLHSGLAEAIKMAATMDRQLFEKIAGSVDLLSDIDAIICRCLELKRRVVEADPKESGLRRVLNFGHTVGHAIEAASGGTLLHGEAVGIGMLYFSGADVRREIEKVLEKYSLPIATSIPKETLLKYIAHDKKASGDEVTVVRVDTLGEFEFCRINVNDILL